MAGFLLAASLFLAGGPVSADANQPKLLFLVVDDGKLIASNIHFNRFDELRLQAKEKIVEQSVAKAVAVVVTNQRIIAYSVFTSAWRPLRTRAGESLVQMEAEDFAAQVMTTERFLNFNGRNGVWAEFKR